jgi:hypothetical protein
MVMDEKKKGWKGEEPIKDRSAEKIKIYLECVELPLY